jgi:hypothetical protein
MMQSTQMLLANQLKRMEKPMDHTNRPLSPMALRHIACKVKAGETEREAEAEPQAVKASRRW